MNIENIQDQSQHELTVVENELFTAPVFPKQKKKKVCSKKDEAKLEEAFKILKESARQEIPPDSCAVYSQHVANKLRSYNNKTRAQAC